jgi:hypothetical protein
VFAVLLLLGWRTAATLIRGSCWSPAVRTAASYGADSVLRALLFFRCLAGRALVPDERRDRCAPRAPPMPRRRSPAILFIYVFTGAPCSAISWLRLEAVFYALAGDHHATQMGLFVPQFLLVARRWRCSLLLGSCCCSRCSCPSGARARVALVVLFHVPRRHRHDDAPRALPG